MSSNIIFNELYEKKVLRIELNNSSKKNALSLEMLEEIASKLSKSTFITKFKCIVITGTKKSAFSSGADLDDVKKLINKNNMNFYHKKMSNLLKIITELKIPVISVIRSHCFGAGFILALHSDILIAAESALFCIPASKLNIKIPKKQILYLQKKINQSFLKDIILTSRKFKASEAYSQNIINAYIKDKELDNFTNNYLNEIVNKEKKINAFYLNLLRN
jgi:enoyl-CoA hydratase/carnithine racemase